MEHMDHYLRKISSFLRRKSIQYIISFSGGYRNDKERARSIIEQSIKVYQDYPVAILTGGTEWNLPKDATQIAKDYKLPVIGVLPQIGEEYKIKGMDLQLIIPSLYGKSEWCDESQLFVKISDGIELIGGGPGTGVEIFQAIKISTDRIHNKIAPIFIAPIELALVVLKSFYMHHLL